MNEQQWRRAVEERKAKEIARKQFERNAQQEVCYPQSSNHLQYRRKEHVALSSVQRGRSEAVAQTQVLESPSYVGNSEYFDLASSAMVSEEKYRELLEYNRRELQNRRGHTLRA
jgi:hypothetical protein